MPLTSALAEVFRAIQRCFEKYVSGKSLKDFFFIFKFLKLLEIDK